MNFMLREELKTPYQDGTIHVMFEPLVPVFFGNQLGWKATDIFRISSLCFLYPEADRLRCSAASRRRLRVA
ncbi:hypothetical protein [Kineobactrum sediminis]|nr:hypothetical protein [Kineobactrum sediminis]